MRRYFCQAIDETTHLPVWAGMVDEFTIGDAAMEGHRQAIFAAGHPRVRVTHIAEQDTQAFAAVLRSLSAGAALALTGGIAA